MSSLLIFAHFLIFLSLALDLGSCLLISLILLVSYFLPSLCLMLIFATIILSFHVFLHMCHVFYTMFFRQFQFFRVIFWTIFEVGLLNSLHSSTFPHIPLNFWQPLTPLTALFECWDAHLFHPLKSSTSLLVS